MSDSGSEIMIASGSRNEPNCITRIRYISITAMPSAEKMRPNTSFWLSTSPPCVMCTPGGRVIFAIRALMSFITSVERTVRRVRLDGHHEICHRGGLSAPDRVPA